MRSLLLHSRCARLRWSSGGNLCTHDWSSRAEAWPKRQTQRGTERAIKCTILPFSTAWKIPLWDLLSFVIWIHLKVLCTPRANILTTEWNFYLVLRWTTANKKKPDIPTCQLSYLVLYFKYKMLNSEIRIFVLEVSRLFQNYWMDFKSFSFSI